MSSQEGSLIGCIFVISQIHSLLRALQEQMRENLTNSILTRNETNFQIGMSTEERQQIANNTVSSHKLFRRGRVQGEIDFASLNEVIHGDFVELFLDLPENIQGEIVDQALHQSGASQDIFRSASTEQLSLSEIRMVLMFVRHNAQTANI